MKVIDLINKLKTFPPNKQVLLSSDEEQNILFRRIEVDDYDSKNIVMFGFSGSELVR